MRCSQLLLLFPASCLLAVVNASGADENVREGNPDDAGAVVAQDQLNNDYFHRDAFGLAAGLVDTFGDYITSWTRRGDDQEGHGLAAPEVQPAEIDLEEEFLKFMIGKIDSTVTTLSRLSRSSIKQLSRLASACASSNFALFASGAGLAVVVAIVFAIALSSSVV